MPNNPFLNLQDPNDILRRIRDERRARIQRDGEFSRNQHRAANVIDGLESLFGTAESRKAKEMQTAVTEATNSFKVDENKSELENEIRRLRHLREVVGDIDPNAQLEINQRLLEMEVIKEERARLKGSDAREQARADREAAEFAAGARDRNIFHVVDDATGASLGRFDTSTPEGIAAAREALQANPDAGLRKEAEFLDDRQEDRLARLRIQEAAAKARALDPNKGKITRLNTLATQSQANFNYTTGVRDLVDLAANSPEAFGVGTNLYGGINKLGAHARSFVESFADTNDLSWNAEVEARALDKLAEANIHNGQAQALVMDIAYAIATSREGGRLTDQDVDRAILTMGGNQPDPRALVAVLGSLTLRKADEWDNRLKLGGLSDNAEANEMWTPTQERFVALREQLAEVEKRYGLTREDGDIFLKTGQKPWDAPARRAPVPTVAPDSAGADFIFVPGEGLKPVSR